MQRASILSKDLTYSARIIKYVFHFNSRDQYFIRKLPRIYNSLVKHDSQWESLILYQTGVRDNSPLP